MSYPEIDRRGIDRRSALQIGAASVVGAGLASQPVRAQESAETTSEAEVLNPRNRVPLSFIIDDSTCLVNMGHFCMPQFAEAWPERETYKQPWRDWPREIPDAFVREFGEWCTQNQVKGKYSIVPYPACVGWLDRGLPGWSKRALEDSLALVRDLMVPNWDIHPEMITHTRVIDIKSGRPLQEANAATMENSYPQTDLSTDYLAEYLAYALRILKNCGLECEGITTPGGFGNRVKSKLPIAVGQAVRDVYSVELPHYFKYVMSADESTQPSLEFDGESSISNLTVNVPAGTGDWFGGWEGSKESQPDKYCTADASAGRMVELIERGEPAVMLCHWPGMYCNGTKTGFHAFQRVVRSLASRYGDETLWMKASEIGRYWAAKEMTELQRSSPNSWRLDSPLACRNFTLSIPVAELSKTPTIKRNNDTVSLREVNSNARLQEGTFYREKNQIIICVQLAKGESELVL